MSVSRLKHITKIGVEDMGDLADGLDDPEVLRLENLDTDLRPPDSALEYTRLAVDDDDANSYLPFLGLDSMRQAAAGLVGRQSGNDYDWKTECIVSAGGLSGILNVLLEELADFELIPPHGGWSFLIDVSSLGLDGPEASRRLLEKGKIAATAMVNWGASTSNRYVRVVFSNEPVERLRGIGERFRGALT